MFDSVSFTVLALGEVILILVIVISLLLILNAKHRQRQRLLIEEYRKLRQNVHIALHSGNSEQLDPLAQGSASPDPIEIFLTNASQESLTRYGKITQTTLPRLSPELPFSAKVAALRYFYTLAEIAIRKKKTTHDEGWMLFEKQLAEIVRWIIAPKKLTPNAPNNRLRLLQEKLDVLKPFETENIKLHKQLKQALTKQKRLEQYQRDSKEALEKLQKIIGVLQLANSYKSDNINDKVEDALNLSTPDQPWPAAEKSYDASIHNLNNIADISERKNSLVKRMVDELPDSYQDLTAEQRKKMEFSIRLLEKDLVKSDHHITNLQKELKAAKASMMEQPPVISEKPITPYNRYSPGKENFLHPIPLQQPETNLPAPAEDSLKIVDTIAPKEEQPDTSNTWVKQGGHQRTLAEIEHLRTNNQSQRNIIIDLEKELRSLRQAMNETSDEDEKASKGKDIARLERLVKECEHCIEILESEVDLLHKQLQQTTSVAVPEKKPEYEVEQLNKELETISNKLQSTIKRYSETSILNRFANDALACTGISDLAKVLIKAVKELHISAGFYLNSTLGQAEFFAGNSFTPAEQNIVKQPNATAPVAYLNEGILFAKPKLHLMLRNPPDDDDEQLQLENTLSNMINIAAAQIEHLEVNTTWQRQTRNLDAWVDETKRQLTDLDIQYAYQSEESRRIVDSLIKELTRTINTMEITGNTRTVFDNTVSECNQRLALLLDSGKTLDHNSSQLIAKLDNLRAHKL